MFKSERFYFGIAAPYARAAQNVKDKNTAPGEGAVKGALVAENEFLIPPLGVDNLEVLHASVAETGKGFGVDLRHPRLRDEESFANALERVLVQVVQVNDRALLRREAGTHEVLYVAPHLAPGKLLVL